MYIVLVYRPEADGGDEETPHRFRPFDGVEVLFVAEDEPTGRVVRLSEDNPTWKFHIEWFTL
jgi:hypothetical protein